MPIVPQSASFPLTLFPPNMPLLLPAPRIAGLLPARCGDPPPDPPPNVAGFTYNNPRLAKLPPDQRDRLYVAAQTLLDVALGRARRTE